MDPLTIIIIIIVIALSVTVTGLYWRGIYCWLCRRGRLMWLVNLINKTVCWSRLMWQKIFGAKTIGENKYKTKAGERMVRDKYGNTVKVSTPVKIGTWDKITGKTRIEIKH